MAEFKVGDVVRRTQGTIADVVREGDIGEVREKNCPGSWFVFNRRTGFLEPWDVAYFELYSPVPTPPAQPAQTHGVSVYASQLSAEDDANLSMQEMMQQQAQHDYLDAITRATNYQYIGQTQQAQQQGLGQRAAPGPCINHVTHERAKELCEEAVKNATVGLRSELADVKGERDAWRVRAERAEKALDLIRGRR